jgi:ABC-type amino acid transport substrate-binding protein
MHLAFKPIYVEIENIITFKSIRKYLIFLLIFKALSVLFFHSAIAQNDSKKETDMKVAIIVEPPYVMKRADGSYHGLSVEVWREISDKNNITYEFIEYDSRSQIMLSLMRKKIDIAINPLPVSSVRLKQFEVTQPYFMSSIGVAGLKGGDEQVPIFINNLMSWSFVKLFSTLLGIIIFFGIVMWIIERKYNKSEFRDGVHGVFDGIWWSIVTISTVGYGDKTPKTILGKTISMVWILSAICLISSFTATITSQLTVNRLELEIERIDDLKTGLKIGCVKSSIAQDYLQSQGIRYVEFETPQDGLKALVNKEVDLFTYDRASLRFLITDEHWESKIRLLHFTFHRQFFSMILPKRSIFYDNINTSLTDLVNSDDWVGTLRKYHLEDFD